MKPLRIGGRFATVLLAIILLLQPVVPSPAFAASNTEQKIDAVLTVDVSNSMNDSDRNKVSFEAMKMFVDMTSVQGDKIGIVSYTDKIVREKALLKINSPQDKQDLKSFIDQLTLGPNTDIAVGVDEAVKVLESGRETGHYPMIVLLADGNNFLAGTRTQEQSDQVLQDSVKRAKQAGIPIYTIGLNADGSLNKSVLENIAKETGGKTFVTSTADNLPQILSEIFASHLKLKVIPLNSITGNGQYQDVTVSVPNASVLEANISLMSDQPVEAKLIDPSGKERALPSDGIVFTKSKAYSLIKINKPAQGDWKLQIKGIDKDKIDINLVFNYDLQLVMDPLNPTYKPGDKVAVKARLESGGQPASGTDLYKNIKSTLSITDKDTNKTQEIPVTNTGQSFEGSFTIAEAHEYEVKLRAEESSFFRETEPVTINAKQAGAGTTTPPAAPAEKKPFPWAYVIGGAVLLLLLIAGYILFSRMYKKANRGFYGQMVLEIRDENTGERTNPQYRKLSAFKGKVKLHQLLQLAPEFAETDKIVFTPTNRDTIIVTNRSSCVLEKSGRVIDAGNGYELKKNDRIKVTLQQVNKSITLDYIV